MKIMITFLFLVSLSPIFAGEETAIDVAKRVIADPSPGRRPPSFPRVPTGIPAPSPGPKDQQLAEAAVKSSDIIRAYMLGDTVSEKIRIAYAISVLKRKRVAMTEKGIPVSEYGFFPANIDTGKNDGFLKDGLVLAARLAEIGKAEAGSSPESKSSGARNSRSK